MMECLRLSTVIMLAVLVLHIERTSCIEVIKPKCEYEDTVDISGSETLANGTILFRGILIPPDLADFYDYEVIFPNTKVTVPRHRRACICLLTTCLKFCCNPKATKVKGQRKCSNELEKELIYAPYFNITASDGLTYERHVHYETFIQEHLPCEYGYTLEENNDEFQLLENGTLLLFNYEKTIELTKNHYCVLPDKSDDNYTLRPLICLELTVEPEPGNLKVNFIIMLISIPLMIITILVYAFIRELRNLHGKCLIAYLIAMAIGDTILNTNTLMGFLEIEISPTWCDIIGYSDYYFIMSAFFWLSIISFDLWYNFRGFGTSTRVSRVLQQRRFYIYSLFGWSLPAILTGLTIGAQMSNINDSFKPGIGIESCWIDVRKWSAMIYFYGPMTLMLFFNSTMFIVTFMTIYHVQKGLSRFAGKAENNRHLRHEKDEFGVFLRLFVVMGVTWIFEVLSYLAGFDSKFFYVTDFLNSAFGIIIFILFVLKRRVRMLIKKRLGCKTGHLEINRRTKYSVRSTTNGPPQCMSLTQDTDI